MTPPSWKTPIRDAGQTAIHIVCHLALAALILVGIWALERLTSLLWSETPLLFGTLPLKYVFHGMDLAVLVVFGFYGTIAIARALRR